MEDQARHMDSGLHPSKGMPLSAKKMAFHRYVFCVL